MLSRIADSLFWLNRYTERADSLLRLTYVHYILSLDHATTAHYTWRCVLDLYSNALPEAREGLERDTPGVLRNLLIDEANDNSIRSLVTKARENARGAQDHITKEMWEVVNQFYHLAHQGELPERLRGDQAIKSIEAFARQTALYTGITDSTMARGLGWNFMNLGKFVERCLQTITITNGQLEALATRGPELNDILQWRYLLLALSGYEMHLKTYGQSNHTESALHQVTLNENFPRSVIYSLTRVDHYLGNIMALHEDGNRELTRSFGQLFSRVRYTDLRRMDLPGLRDFLDDVRCELLRFSFELGQYYFSYS